MTPLDQCNLEPDIKLIKAILMGSNYRGAGPLESIHQPSLEGSVSFSQFSEVPIRSLLSLG